MSAIVVDASVALKWFVPEVHSAAAASWLEQGHVLRAPDLLFPEIGNILWKKIARRELTAAEGRKILRGVESLGIRAEPSSDLLPIALEIALGLGRTVYDSMYLALALRRDVPVVTADRKLHQAVVGSVLGGLVRWVEEEPSSVH